MTQILLFSSPNCAPCRQLKPNLLRLQEIHQFKLTVYELSDETMPTFSRYSVRMSPTVIAVDEDGKRTGIFVGAQSPGIIENHLRKWGAISG